MILSFIPFIVQQDPSSTGARHARLQICSSFIRIARAADKSLLPHMKVRLSMLLIECCLKLQSTCLAWEPIIALISLL